jgi:hypothetical protein
VKKYIKKHIWIKKVLAVLHKMTKTGEAVFWLIGLHRAQKYGQSPKKTKTLELLICFVDVLSGKVSTTLKSEAGTEHVWVSRVQ